MFLYRVNGETTEKIMNIDFRNLDQASERYYDMVNDEGYFKGSISNNETGEVYAHFEKEITPHSITVISYCARHWD